MIPQEFCLYCGAGVGEFKRDGEGTCPKCDSTIKYKTITIYDPPSGWRYGFPREYEPLRGESLVQTLLRDGYPQKEIDSFKGDVPCRFWEAKKGNYIVNSPKGFK